LSYYSDVFPSILVPSQSLTVQHVVTHNLHSYYSLYLWMEVRIYRLRSKLAGNISSRHEWVLSASECLGLLSARAFHSCNGGYKEFHILCLLSASFWFPVWLILQHWRWIRHVPPKCQLSFNGLHYVTSQQAELFISHVSRIWIIVRALTPCLSYINQLNASKYGSILVLIKFSFKRGQWEDIRRFCVSERR
jgi:hypothetical protein